MIGDIMERFSRIPSTFNSLLQALSLWMLRCNSESQYGLCRIAVAAYILQEIWVVRCRATYDDTPMSARDICLKINQRVQLLNLIISSKIPSKNIHLYMLEALGIDRKPPLIRRGLC